MADEQPKYGGGWLAGTSARYQTRVSLVSPLAGAVRLLLAADPRRWYLRISSTTAGGSTATVAPGPPPTGGGTIPATPLPIEIKFRDAPHMVTGEWYAINAGALQFVIWEELYVGD